MTSSDPLSDAGAREILRSLSDAARTEMDGHVNGADHARTRAALLARLHGGPAPHAAVWNRAWAARSLAFGLGLAVAITALVWFFHARTATRALTFAVDGRDATLGATVRAENQRVDVRFDDGTDVVFHPGATGRIAELSPHGARVVVGEGHTHFAVVHRPGAAWSVEAGPYVVRVTGTEFDLDWSPASGALRVVMFRGSVAVEGTATPVESLVAGSVLDVGERGKFTIRSEVDALSAGSPGDGHSGEVAAPGAPSSASAVSVVPSASCSAGAPIDASRGAPAPIVSAPRVTWAKAVELGQYDAVVREASAQGIDLVARTARLDDLVALADAGRYSGHPDLANRVLVAVRSRFPESQAGHTAAFLLGRMAEESGSPEQAIALYDEYLASGGAFADEALGRKLMAVTRARGRDAALPIAREYLARFPKGAFATTATSIAGDPP